MSSYLFTSESVSEGKTVRLDFPDGESGPTDPNSVAVSFGDYELLSEYTPFAITPEAGTETPPSSIDSSFSA